jgi:hypothetical protein
LNTLTHKQSEHSKVSLKQQQRLGNFPTASSWCEKTNMMMADKERLAEVVPGGCSSEKRLGPA